MGLADDVAAVLPAGEEIPDLDIYRSANVLIREHGEDAPMQAATRADAMFDKGGLDGYAV